MMSHAPTTRHLRRPILFLVALVMASTATVATAANAVVAGPDVSSNNHANGGFVNWGTVHGVGGASFAFVKATEGGGYANPYFASDFASIHANRMIRGAYHFASPRGTTNLAIAANATLQANFFVRTAGTLRAVGDLPPVLDLENAGNLNAAQLILWTHTWLNRARRLTGRTPIMYTYAYFWQNSMANSKAFAAYPLWLAYYSKSSPPKVGGWTRNTFWQYTDRAVRAGASRPMDMSIFNGSVAQLRVMANYRTNTLRITAALSALRVRSGKTIYLRGTASRALARKTIYLERYYSRAWHVQGTTKAPAGTYSFPVRTWAPVSYYRTVVKPSGSGWLVSSTRTLRTYP